MAGAPNLWDELMAPMQAAVEAGRDCDVVVATARRAAEQVERLHRAGLLRAPGDAPGEAAAEQLARWSGTRRRAESPARRCAAAENMRPSPQ